LSFPPRRGGGIQFKAINFQFPNSKFTISKQFPMNQFPISKRLEIKDLEIEICLEIGNSFFDSLIN